MATLVLSAVGNAIGGPVGGTIGALIGQQVDQKIFGPGPREGPRLKEVAVTTSTYGQPIPRHYGRMRVGGVVLWATDLKEDREVSGGKGRPRTTAYSYSASFAVLLASSPLDRVGRIWADGNLLRGSAGDLKAPGTMRFHPGHFDAQPDPLMRAALGAKCPAYRGRAYVVFEDLQLAEFGNRLPMLTFEVFAGDASGTIARLTMDAAQAVDAPVAIPQLEGFSHEGGTYRQVLSAFAEVRPIYPVCTGTTLRLHGGNDEAAPMALSAAAAWSEGGFGERSGLAARRKGTGREQVEALRYYDVGRDYQPGLQRTAGRFAAGSSRQIDLPASLTAAGARELVDAAAQRSLAAQDTMTWRTAELDPAVMPGNLVQVPGRYGVWRVLTWEWRTGGVELELLRAAPVRAAARGSDAGSAWAPPDAIAGPTLIHFFELPASSLEEVNRPALFAAVRSSGQLWKGAALYRQRLGELVPLATGAARQAGIGVLCSPLPPSAALRFEPNASCEVDVGNSPVAFAGASLAGLAEGVNRILIGSEILQFAEARHVTGGVWRLAGLLRGRGGTEDAAGAGHGTGTAAILLDAGLTPIDTAEFAGTAEPRLLAIGLADEEPVAAPLVNAGATRRPLAPVHGRWRALPDGGVDLRWTRRARGAWLWPEGTEVPLVEEAERYLVGIGDPAAPLAAWETGEPRLVLSAVEIAATSGWSGSAGVWVRQIGSFALSQPCFIGPAASAFSQGL